MPQTPAEFIALGHRTISTIFLDGVELLTSLCEKANRDFLVKFLMTRLEGEAIETKPQDAESIVTQLKGRIKTESSTVIEGRIWLLGQMKIT